MPDDFGEGDFLGRPGQPVTALDPASALDDARVFEIIEDLLEEALGNALLGRDFADAQDSFTLVQAEGEGGTKSVFTT